MLMQIKVYLIGALYFCGASFMILFPPRNYELYAHNLSIIYPIMASPLSYSLCCGVEYLAFPKTSNESLICHVIIPLHFNTRDYRTKALCFQIRG